VRDHARARDPRWGFVLQAIVEEAREAAVSRAPKAERLAELRVLALRWRSLAEIVGQDSAGTEPRFTKARGVLQDALRRSGTPFMAALDAGARADWILELGRAAEDLEEARTLAREREDRARAAQVLFDDLRSLPTRSFIAEDPEAACLFRERLAELASYLPLREELGRFARPYREVLGPGFEFLWKEKGQEDGEGEEKGTRREPLSRRRLLERMLGRMVSKHAIGGVHAPVGLVLRGFPPHQAGLAKEALDAACRAGVVARKSTHYGERVYLAPALVGSVKAFLAGAPFGIATLDRWAAEGAREEAA
jgi:hypothetical protein